MIKPKVRVPAQTTDIVEAMFLELLSRKGFAWWWHELFAPIQQDIVDSLAIAVQRKLLK